MNRAGHMINATRSDRPRWQSLLRRTMRRLRIASIARRSLWMLSGLTIAYGSALLAGRLTGLLRWRPEPVLLLFLPVFAAFLVVFFPRKPTIRDAARAVDRHGRTDDLFLTMVSLDHSAGQYQPLVAAKAEARACTIRPADVAPLGLNRRLIALCLAIIAVVSSIHFVPQLDPFGKVEAAQQAEKELKHLDAAKKATAERLAQIERENLSDLQSQEVKQALDRLKTAVNAARPKARQANAQSLAAAQKNLGEQWRKISAEQLKELLSHSSTAQQFGGSSARNRKWLDELQAGSTESLQKELKSVQQDLEELAKTKDPFKQAQLTKKLRERLDALAEFANDQVSSKSLTAAIKRVEEQMRTAAKMADHESVEDALKGASESTKLAQKELEQIAQTAKDLAELEKALQVLQMAKQLNASNGLDGAKCEGCQSLADYEALFAKLMKERGAGLGEEGVGEGGVAPEDNSKSSKFKTEISQSHITKGKVLLTLKTKGMGEHVDVKAQYRAAVRDVKQAVGEAILQEEVPPGYHEGIKSYFDTLDDASK